MAIEVNGMTTVVAHRRACNTNGDNQILHGHVLGSDNVKISIVEPLDINVYLPYPTDEMTTVGDVASFFYCVINRTYFFACPGMLSK